LFPRVAGPGEQNYKGKERESFVAGVSQGNHRKKSGQNKRVASQISAGRRGDRKKTRGIQKCHDQGEGKSFSR